MTRRAYAKVNLALTVGPPVPPRGYHPIVSWMAAIDLYDDLTLTRLADGEASRYQIGWAPGAPRPSSIDWPIEKDLAVRAHRALEAHVGRALPVSLRMEKRTPVGGGLGGGSSDAAAMLTGLNELFGLGLSPRALAQVASPLGSDIGFFLDESSLRGGPPLPAIVSGLGDRIERIGSVKGELTLLVPPFGCPTGPVYAAFDRGPGARRPLREEEVRRLARRAIGLGSLASVRHEMFNDLEGPACEVEPRLGALLRDLRAGASAAGAVHVTGSGSTMFAVGAMAGGSGGVVTVPTRTT